MKRKQRVEEAFRDNAVHLCFGNTPLSITSWDNTQISRQTQHSYRFTRQHFARRLSIQNSDFFSVNKFVVETGGGSHPSRERHLLTADVHHSSRVPTPSCHRTWTSLVLLHTPSSNLCSLLTPPPLPSCLSSLFRVTFLPYSLFIRETQRAKAFH